MILNVFMIIIRERTTSGTYVEVQCKIDGHWSSKEKVLVPKQYFDDFIKIKQIEVSDDETREFPVIMLDYVKKNNFI